MQGQDFISKFSKRSLKLLIFFNVNHLINKVTGILDHYNLLECRPRDAHSAILRLTPSVFSVLLISLESLCFLMYLIYVNVQL